MATIQVAHPLSDYCCLILLYKVVLTTHYCLRSCLSGCLWLSLLGLATLWLPLCFPGPLFELTHFVAIIPVVAFSGWVWWWWWWESFRFSRFSWQSFPCDFRVVSSLLPFWHSLDCVLRPEREQQTLMGICFCFQFYALITLMNNRDNAIGLGQDIASIKIHRLQTLVLFNKLQPFGLLKCKKIKNKKRVKKTRTADIINNWIMYRLSYVYMCVPVCICGWLRACVCNISYWAFNLINIEIYFRELMNKWNGILILLWKVQNYIQSAIMSDMHFDICKSKMRLIHWIRMDWYI